MKKRKRTKSLRLLCSCGTGFLAIWVCGVVRRKIKCPACGNIIVTLEAAKRRKSNPLVISESEVREAWPEAWNTARISQTSWL